MTVVANPSVVGNGLDVLLYEASLMLMSTSSRSGYFRSGLLRAGLAIRRGSSPKLFAYRATLLLLYPFSLKSLKSLLHHTSFIRQTAFLGN